MTQKVIFFTASSDITGPEATALAKLEAAAKPYEVVVRSNAASALYGSKAEACDLVAGVVPSAYSAKPVINPDALPNLGLEATEAVIAHNVDIVVPVTGVYATKIKPTIVAGVITGFVLS